MCVCMSVCILKVQILKLQERRRQQSAHSDYKSQKKYYHFPGSFGWLWPAWWRSWWWWRKWWWAHHAGLQHCEIYCSAQIICHILFGCWRARFLANFLWLSRPSLSNRSRSSQFFFVPIIWSLLQSMKTWRWHKKTGMGKGTKVKAVQTTVWMSMVWQVTHTHTCKTIRGNRVKSRIT